MILDGPKFKIFNFVGAPVKLSLLFFFLIHLKHQSYPYCQEFASHEYVPK